MGHVQQGGAPLIATDRRDAAREVSLLLARHPIPTYLHITSALLGANEWGVEPTAIVRVDDDVIAVQLEQAGWAVDELAAIGPRARRELLLEAYAIEQRGVPWPHVRWHQTTGNT